MRFLYLLIFFVYVENGIAQHNFKFDESSYQTIIQKSQKEHKAIFLMFHASWCPHCAKMKTEVLNQKSVSDLLETNYVCTTQDTDSEEGKMLKSKFNITALPTFLILDSDGVELYRLKGEYKTDPFIAEINNAMNSQQQLPYLEKEFLSAPTNTLKWLNYMNVLKKGRDRAYLNEKVKPYLATQSDKALINEANWQIIANCVTDISSREFQSVLQHKKEYEKVSSPIRVERKINNIVIELLKPLVETNDTIAYYKEREVAKTIHLQKTDSIIFRYDLMIAEKTKNWKQYKKVSLESTAKFAWNDAAWLKEISLNFLKYVPDSSSLKQATQWTTRSLVLNDSYDGNLLLSFLYLKTKDRNAAITAARKAKVICTAYGFDTKEVDALFIKLGIKK